MNAAGEIVYAGTGPSPWFFVFIGLLILVAACVAAAVADAIADWVDRKTAPDPLPETRDEAWLVGPDPFLLVDEEACSECRGMGVYDVEDGDGRVLFFDVECRACGGECVAGGGDAA